jgi:hypothetical protein
MDVYVPEMKWHRISIKTQSHPLMYIIIVVIIILVVLGFYTQGFTLAKQLFYCLSHFSSLFWSDYFGHGVSGIICLG